MLLKLGISALIAMHSTTRELPGEKAASRVSGHFFMNVEDL